MDNLNIGCCNAPASAGKTHAIVKQAKNAARWGRKSLVVMPTLELIEKTILNEVGPTSFPVTPFHNGVCGKNVVANLSRHFQQTGPSGEIVFTTHAAMLRLDHVYAPGRWTVYVDEVFNDYVKIEELRLPEPDTYQTFSRHFDLKDGFLLPGTGPSAHPEKVAKNEGRDALWKVFQGVASRVVSDHWRVHCEINEEGTVRTTSFLLPSLFKGFEKVVMASANFDDKILVKAWGHEGVTFIPDESLKLRFRTHENCERLTIRYVFDHSWSKAFRNSSIHVEGKDISIGKYAFEAVKQHVGANDVLVMRNNDMVKSFKDWGTATPLSGSPHGLNCYTHFNHFAAFSALNPDPPHLKFLTDKLHVTEDEVRNCMYREAVYQGLFRSNIRIPNSAMPVECVVMDKGTADWLATKLPGCRIEPLASAVEFEDVAAEVAQTALVKKKPGRKPTSSAKSPAERKAAQRARQKAA